MSSMNGPPEGARAELARQQNYYASPGNPIPWFSPMVFIGVDFWTRTFPVAPALRALFGDDRFEQHCLFTDDVEVAASFLLGFDPAG